MPNIKFTYNSKLPYHATHKIDGQWKDVCLGTGDTIELSENAQAQPEIKNLINIKVLVAEDAKAIAPKPKATRSNKTKAKEPEMVPEATNNIQTPSIPQ